MIEIHMAPLQGYTDAIFRQLFEKYYGGIDYYYTPFIRIEHGDFRVRDIRDIAIEGQTKLIPQILPANAEEFSVLVEKIMSYGYQNIDINMGCPFPPITAHGRGCALLNIPQKAIEILDATRQYSQINFSVKMRLGFLDTTQWHDVIDALNTTQLNHITVHARYGKQQYKGECDMQQFAEFVRNCRHKVIYNGDIKTVERANEIIDSNKNIGGIMIGRGLLSNLNLAKEIKGLAPSDISSFKSMHADMVDMLSQRLNNDQQVVEKMKPYWEYLFLDADHKLKKHIKKANKMSEYIAASSELIHSLF